MSHEGSEKVVSVLICEDESITALRLREELTQLGYKIVGEAADGYEAVHQAAMLRPDVILMDIKMPKMDGITATRRIMATAPTAIVMLTAYSQRDLIEDAVGAGAMGYLVKPVSRDQLLPALTVAIRRFAEFQSVKAEAADAKEALETRKLVERAKGVLMQRSNLSEAEAFKRMQKMSQDHSKPLKQIAEEILKADSLFGS
jgi:response regulator NasT